ncbi:unnamed protein product, partial [marine sediment metagenome]
DLEDNEIRKFLGMASVGSNPDVKIVVQLDRHPWPFAEGAWLEHGDAPDLLPAQHTRGTGPLNLIKGTLSDPNDADLYFINITDYVNFSATTVGHTTIDTRLYLFFDTDPNNPVYGNGITFNDDDPGGGGTQSTITGQFLTANGRYVLGISAYARNAQNPVGDNIWNATPYDVERPPDGPGAPGPLDQWCGTGSEDGSYGIGLAGARYSAGGYTAAFGNWSDTRRGIINFGDVPSDGTDGNPAWGESRGELNMGDPNSLIEFVEWGMQDYPASDYAVVLSNHGSG